MLYPWLLGKAINFLRIARMPGALRAKFSHPAFNSHEWETCQRLKQLAIQPLTLVDVGANRGQFAWAAATQMAVRNILCFEPQKPEEKWIRSIPMPHGTRWQVFPLALGSRSGNVPMQVMTASASSSLLRLGKIHRDLYPQIREEASVTVSVARMDEIPEIQSIRGPAFLKLDVQGYELEVLRGGGASLSAFQWIYLETSTLPFYQEAATFEEILGFLRGHGFFFFGPIGTHFPDGAAPAASLQFDALFQRSPSFES